MFHLKINRKSKIEPRNEEKEELFLSADLAKSMHDLHPGEILQVRSAENNEHYAILNLEDLEFILEKAGMQTRDKDSTK